MFTLGYVSFASLRSRDEKCLAHLARNRVGASHILKSKFIPVYDEHIAQNDYCSLDIYLQCSQNYRSFKLAAKCD